MTALQPKTLEVRMNIEHLQDALQHLFRRFGYIQMDGEYFELRDFRVEPNDVIYVNGKVVAN